MITIDKIKRKIEDLKRLDTDYKIFGAGFHKYQMNETIPDLILDEFEKKYQIELPPEYRLFLTQIGNGGAGPFYGIFPLKKNLGEFNPENRFEFLKYDFPHQVSWNWSEPIFNKFDLIQEEENEEISDFFDKVFYEQYYKNELTHGSIYLSDYGCALRFLLVIKGSEKGNIWFDQRADRKGITPVIDSNGNKVNFSAWYLNWLEESIEKLR